MRPSGYAALLSSVTTANLADGVYLAAGPLLAARLTSDPALVAGVVLVQRLAVVLALPAAGLAVDSRERRRVIVVGNLVRAGAFGLVLGMLLAGLAGPAALVVLYAAAAVLGGAEAFVDTSTFTMPPAVVPGERLAEANGRVQTMASAGQDLVGPPLGGVLSAVAAWPAFLLVTVCFGAAAGFASLLPARRSEVGAREGAPASVRTRLSLGWRAFWSVPVLRWAAVGAAGANFLAAGALSVLVLLVTRELGLSEAVYGACLVGLAAGAMLAGATVHAAGKLLGPGTLIFLGNVGVAAGMLLIAKAEHVWSVAAGLVTVSFAATTSNVVLQTVRQVVVEDDLLGRVTAAYRLLALAGVPLGAATAGLLARADLRLPYWVAAAGFLVLALVLAVGLGDDRLRRAVRPAAASAGSCDGEPVSLSRGPDTPDLRTGHEERHHGRPVGRAVR